MKDRGQALVNVNSSLSSLDELISEAYSSLRQGYEILNFCRTSPAAKRAIYTLDASWNALYLTSTLRICDLFSEDATVNSLSSLLALVSHEAVNLASGTAVTSLRKEIENGWSYLATIRKGEDYRAVEAYRNEVGIKRTLKGLPPGAMGKGFTTRQARDLIEKAFYFLNTWKSKLGLPTIEAPRVIADTRVFFEMLESGSDVLQEPNLKGWRFGSQDWRGPFQVDSDHT